MPKSLIISAPGKLFISGEWAVLEPKNPAIVAAVDKRIFVKIANSQDEKFHLSLKNYNLKSIKAEFRKNRLDILGKLSVKERKILVFTQKAIEVGLRYLGKQGPFNLEIWGETGEKIGLGFSAASTVALVAALLKTYGQKLNKEKIFKLAAISHFLAQGEAGSGADIAASVYGGCLAYQRFNPDWLKKQIKNKRNLKEIVETAWPNRVKKLNWPRGLKLLVGWTDKPSSTPKLIKKMKEWQKKSPGDYQKIISKISKTTKKMILSFKKKDKKEILKLIKENEKYLKKLGEKAKVKIETKKLKILSEIAEKFQGAGKVSGAGGGDCGICLVLSQKNAEKIKKEWQKKGILPIETKIDFKGVKTL